MLFLLNILRLYLLVEPPITFLRMFCIEQKEFMFLYIEPTFLGTVWLIIKFYLGLKLNEMLNA